MIVAEGEICPVNKCKGIEQKKFFVVIGHGIELGVKEKNFFSIKLFSGK